MTMRIAGVGWLVLVVLSVCGPSPCSVSARLSLRDRLSLEHSHSLSHSRSHDSASDLDLDLDQDQDQYLVYKKGEDKKTKEPIYAMAKYPKLDIVKPATIQANDPIKAQTKSQCGDKKPNDDEMKQKNEWKAVPTDGVLWANKGFTLNKKAKTPSTPKFYVNIGWLYNTRLFGAGPSADPLNLPTAVLKADKADKSGLTALNELSDLLNHWIGQLSDPKKGGVKDQCVPSSGNSYVCLLNVWYLPNEDAKAKAKPKKGDPPVPKPKPSEAQLAIWLEEQPQPEPQPQPDAKAKAKAKANTQPKPIWKVCDITQRPGAPPPAGEPPSGEAAPPSSGDAPAAQPAADQQQPAAEPAADAPAP